MEKSRISPVKAGKGIRMSYSRQKEVLEMPNLIEVQKNSYQWFLDAGLKEVFEDISPITDYSGQLSLEFVDFQLCEDDIKYSIEECKERDATYAAPLKVNVRLHNKETDEINQHDIFMGDLPLMTETGTFVINGAERVIVSQLVRSPGIYYAIGHDKTGKELYSCTVIPNRGAWLEYETDQNDVFYVRVDRTRKVPITVLIRSLGIGTNEEIRELFGDEIKILKSMEKDTATSYEEGLLELYKKIRPGEPLAVESAESLINAMFFDPRRYDLAKVGRYKFNKKLSFKNRIAGQTLAEDVVSPVTGEILAKAGDTLTRESALAIQNAAVPYVMIQTESRNVKVLSNMMVDIKEYVDFDAEELGVTEAVFYPVLAQLLEEYTDEEELKRAIKRDIHDLIPKHITKEDILASINYNKSTISEIESLVNGAEGQFGFASFNGAKPINEGVRQFVQKLIGYEWGANFVYKIGTILGSTIIPLMIVFVLLMYGVYFRRKELWLSSIVVFVTISIVFLTAPAANSMYYYSLYNSMYLLLIVWGITKMDELNIKHK